MEINTNTALFICAIEENTMILCEKHAQAFEKAAMLANTPHTIIEMDEIDGHKCMACNLVTDIIDNQPRIILN